MKVEQFAQIIYDEFSSEGWGLIDPYDFQNVAKDLQPEEAIDMNEHTYDNAMAMRLVLNRILVKLHEAGIEPACPICY